MFLTYILDFRLSVSIVSVHWWLSILGGQHTDNTQEYAMLFDILSVA
jgi:hypothetical protein